jgi:hypothetical protein
MNIAVDIHQQELEAFCHECHDHVLSARQALAECPSPECLDRIYDEYNQLRASAQSMHRFVMEKYAGTMARFASHLRHHRNKISNEEKELLSRGIDFALECKGTNRSRCPAMHFDELVPILESIENHIQSAE